MIDKKEAIKEVIDKSRQLLDLYNSPAYQNHLRPYLEAMTKVKWLEPKDYDSYDKFVADYQYHRARANVCEEIMHFLANQQATMNSYIKTLKQYEQSTTN